MKRRLSLFTVLVTLIVICAGATQLQTALVQGLGAANGTFGLRPMSQGCLGLRLAGEKLTWLPEGDSEARLLLFTFRYQLPADPPADQTFCLGQDLWYGE